MGGEDLANFRGIGDRGPGDTTNWIKLERGMSKRFIEKGGYIKVEKETFLGKNWSLGMGSHTNVIEKLVQFCENQLKKIYIFWWK